MEFDFEAERVFDSVGSLLKFHSVCLVCRGVFLIVVVVVVLGSCIIVFDFY